MIAGNSYFFAQPGESCADLTTGTILTMNECESAFSKIQKNKPRAIFIKKELNTGWFPKGCFIASDDPDVHDIVFWNSHETDDDDDDDDYFYDDDDSGIDYHKICIAIGT